MECVDKDLDHKDVIQQDQTVATYCREDLPSNVTGLTPVQRLEANIEAASAANLPLVDQRRKRLALARIRIAEITKMQDAAVEAIATGAQGRGKVLKQGTYPKPIIKPVREPVMMPQPILDATSGSSDQDLMDEMLGHMFADPSETEKSEDNE